MLVVLVVLVQVALLVLDPIPKKYRDQHMKLGVFWGEDFCLAESPQNPDVWVWGLFDTLDTSTYLQYLVLKRME